MNNPWTDADVDYLREHYCCMRVALIAVQLKRTTNSVIGKASRLGLRVDREEKQRRIFEGHAACLAP